MTRDDLTTAVHGLAQGVLDDPRWTREKDDLGVTVLGMILYGYALATGRMAMFLDQEDADACVLTVLTGCVGVAAKWGGGLVEEASASAFDESHHPGYHELIGVGHSYFGVKNRAALVDNIFANIDQADPG